MANRRSRKPLLILVVQSAKASTSDIFTINDVFLWQVSRAVVSGDFVSGSGDSALEIRLPVVFGVALYESPLRSATTQISVIILDAHGLEYLAGVDL